MNRPPPWFVTYRVHRACAHSILASLRVALRPFLSRKP